MVNNLLKGQDEFQLHITVDACQFRSAHLTDFLSRNVRHLRFVDGIAKLVVQEKSTHVTFFWNYQNLFENTSQKISKCLQSVHLNCSLGRNDGNGL